jgi:hypothetical protein
MTKTIFFSGFYVMSCVGKEKIKRIFVFQQCNLEVENKSSEIPKRNAKNCPFWSKTNRQRDGQENGFSSSESTQNSESFWEKI